MSRNIVALVPMKHVSERVPGKNYRPLGGRPLYHHIVTNLLEVPYISKVVINTDSPTIKEDAERSFSNVVIVDRPKHLLGGDVPTNAIIEHDMGLHPADFYVQTHSTNPLLTTATIKRAIETFFDNATLYDSLFSVTRMYTRYWDSLARPVNHNPAILLRTQDLPPIYEENSCIYLFSKDSFIGNQNRIGRRPYMFETDPYESVDIDEEIDFQIAQFLYEKRTEGEFK